MVTSRYYGQSGTGGAQARFWEMHDLLFGNQDALEDEDLAGYAAELHLDSRLLVSQLATGAYSERVREDLTSGLQSGVNGTPTFFINGRHYDGPHGFGQLLAALESAGQGPAIT